jgi:hypothetical protein
LDVLRFDRFLKPAWFQESIKPENVQGVVYKIGAVTDYREGTIVDTAVDLYIDYSFGTFLFENQILIDGGKDPDGEDDQKVFAAAGDSGSLVFDSQKRATAMIFAASGRYAVACPIDNVLSELGKKLNKKTLAPLRLAVGPAFAGTKLEQAPVALNVPK